jgi:hypothetical protein
MSLYDTTHCLLYGKRTEKSLMLSTVMRTVNELIETVTAHVTIWTMFFKRTIASFTRVSSAFCKPHFAYALIFNKLSSEPRSTVPVLGKAWT